MNSKTMAIASGLAAVMSMVGGKNFTNNDATRKKNRSKNKAAKKSKQTNRKK